MKPMSRRRLLAITALALVGSGPASRAAAVGTRPCEGLAGDRRRTACTASLMPSSYSMMQMGVPDYGGGPIGHAPHRRLDSFQAPGGVPDVRFALTAAMGNRVIGGVWQRVMTFNGSTPGPTLQLTQGDLVEVVLKNENVARGVTIHWHGVDLVGSQDGVAGVTQNAVLPGEEYIYRFVVPDAGTYWYHSHQDSVREVRMGLIGALVILPRPDGPAVALAEEPDLVALVHTYGSMTTLNGVAGSTYVPATVGTARVRFVNANNGPILVSATQPFAVAAIDGYDISGATDLPDTYVDVPAGGRVDLLVPVGPQNVRVGMLSGPSLVIGPDGAAAAPELGATARFDALHYGTPGGSAEALSVLGPAHRTFTYRIGSRAGFLNGRAGNWFTINRRIIPKVPIFMVREGDVARFRIVNATPFLVHPMHLHGHHALVVSRNGVAATGAPWWVDSLEVLSGETFEIVMRADNPGAWMFHCHNLPHARAGLMTHMMYEGVHSPYKIGRVTNQLINQPE